MKQVYVSCPLGVALTAIHDVGRKLKDLGYSSWWYERGTTYDDQKLRLSDIFVLMSEHNKFDYTTSDMTAGCKKELEQARSLGKPLFMAYWKNKKELNIYPLNIKQLNENYRVLGQSGIYMAQASKVIDNYPIF